MEYFFSSDPNQHSQTTGAIPQIEAYEGEQDDQICFRSDSPSSTLPQLYSLVAEDEIVTYGTRFIDRFTSWTREAAGEPLTFCVDLSEEVMDPPFNASDVTAVRFVFQPTMPLPEVTSTYIDWTAVNDLTDCERFTSWCNLGPGVLNTPEHIYGLTLFNN